MLIINIIRYQLLLFIGFLFLACSTGIDPKERFFRTQQIAAQKEWGPLTIHTDTYVLKAFVPQKKSQSENITIFIEGDGFAWLNKNQPSDNPTPKNPVALKIALSLNNPYSAYLSRPCQNVFDDEFADCTKDVWTAKSFSDKTILSINQGIDQIKKLFGATKITLVGYSGGGVIALLVALERNDISRIITVASNIDTDTWTELHHLTPLNGKNPALFSRELTNIPQVHYSGNNDEIVPPQISEEYVKHFAEPSNITRIPVENFSHGCCWENTTLYWK